MTISSTTRKAGPFTGNGVTVAFPFAFKVFTSADVLAVQAVEATGVETTLVLTTNYTVALNADQNANPGGTVTLLTAPPVGTTLVLTSQVANLQATDLTNAGGFYPKVINDALDRATIQIQQLAEKLGRALKIPVSSTASGDLPTPVGGTVLGWNATGTAIVNFVLQAGTSLVNLAASGGSALIGFIQAGVGAVLRTLQDKARERVSVQDFGAAGDGVTNDTAAIQAAMTASAGKELNFGDGYTFLINAEIAGVSNIEIVGHSTIKAVTRIRSYFYFGAQTNVRITGLIFDLGQSVLPTYTSVDYAAAVYAASNYNQAVYCYQSNKIYIRDCQLNNLYTAALFFYQCSDVIDVIGNRFESPLQAQDQNANHVMFQTCSAWISVQNNKFRNAYPTTGVRYGVAGVYTSGLTGTLDVCNNLFLYCGRNSVGGHQLGAYSSYGDVAQGVIRNNVFLLSNQQVIRLTCCHHMDVYGNYCTMNALAGGDDQMVSIEGTTTLGVAPFGCDDIKVHHNTFQDDYASNRLGVFAGAYDWGYPLKDITISDNLFLGMKYAVRLSGPYNRLRVERNNLLGINGNIISYDITVVTPASTYGLQANASMKNLSIQGNIIDSTSGPATTPINLIFTGFTGSIQESTISDNRIISGTANAASAIAYRGVASGDLRITNNYITGFALPLDAQTGSTLLFADNTCRSWTATLPTSTSSWTTSSFTNNSYSTGARSGTARLAAGTVTVATPEVLTGDVISVTRTTVDGSALGHLSQPSIVTKTSFVINSNAPTESNFVAWEIKH